MMIILWILGFPQQRDNLHSDVYGSHMISEARVSFLNINISLRYLKPAPV